MLWPAPVPSREPPRSFTTTLAPSRASVSAYSRPRPPPAPVTTMTRSTTPGMGLPLLRLTERNSCIRGPSELRTPGLASGLLRDDEGRERVRIVGHRDVDPAPEPAHLVDCVLSAGQPAVRVEPVGDVGTVRIVVGEVLHVDRALDAELVGELLEAFPYLSAALVGVVADRFRRDPAAGRAQLGDQFEQPVLSVG